MVNYERGHIAAYTINGKRLRHESHKDNLQVIYIIPDATQSAANSFVIEKWIIEGLGLDKKRIVFAVSVSTSQQRRRVFDNRR